MKRALSLVAAAIALWPAVAMAADVSDPASLRAILPEAPDATWIEALPGQTGYLDGPLTYDSITAYYTYYRQSQSYIEAALSILRTNGFKGGYQRTWYRPGTQDQLFESVRVFPSEARATSAFDDYRSASQAVPKDSSFDPQLGGVAYGDVEPITGYFFTGVIFVKGDAMYNVDFGTVKALKPADVIPQARALFAAAPADIALPPPPQSPLARFKVPLVVTFVSGAVLIAIALVIAAIGAITPPRAVAPRRV